MRSFRFVALSWVVAMGCYSDRQQQSTLPEPDPDPRYISGPPGGAMDPTPAYGQSPAPVIQSAPSASAIDEPPGSTQDIAGSPDGYADDGEPGGAPQAAPPPMPPGAPGMPQGPDINVAGPGVSGGIAGPGVSGGIAGPGIAASGAIRVGPALPAPGAGGPGPDDESAPDDAMAAPTGDATAAVTDPEIDAALNGYGQWIDTEDYGEVWRPDATVVGADFTPYESGGSWADTDAGWAFASDYSWGWLPFHYGRWAWFHDYWGWVPGHRWGPAWVEWRHGGGVVGWRPLEPGQHHGSYHYGSGTTVIRDHRRSEQHDANWRFATVNDFGRPHIRSHLYGNLAEGLRVTSHVAAPPLRARTTLHAGDLMRGRYGSRPVRTEGRFDGRFDGRAGGAVGGAQVRDHRDAYGHSYQPSGGDSPAARGYVPPPRVESSPARGGNPSGGSYAPGRSYAPPRGYSPSHGGPPSGGAAPSRSSGSHFGGGSSHSSSGGSSHSSSGGGSSSGGSSHSSSGGSSHSSSGHK
ncbi:MAG TPA: DUF6600 domain-containing protein [Kofleriaceae bacterium]|jgi:hypothetical protein|nr:DUF6600 domain-containing protein [Kofleriaceae bacterium]